MLYVVALPDPVGVWPLNGHEPLADITGTGNDARTDQTVTIDQEAGNYGESLYYIDMSENLRQPKQVRRFFYRQASVIGFYIEQLTYRNSSELITVSKEKVLLSITMCIDFPK